MDRHRTAPGDLWGRAPGEKDARGAAFFGLRGGKGGGGGQTAAAKGGFPPDFYKTDKKYSTVTPSPVLSDDSCELLLGTESTSTDKERGRIL